jgi:hypothetical protein
MALEVQPTPVPEVPVTLVPVVQDMEDRVDQAMPVLVVLGMLAQVARPMMAQAVQPTRAQVAHAMPALEAHATLDPAEAGEAAPQFVVSLCMLAHIKFFAFISEKSKYVESFFRIFLSAISFHTRITGAISKYLREGLRVTLHDRMPC